MKLDDHVAALSALGTADGRAFGAPDDHALAEATRLRIRASLERPHALRRHASVLVTLAILFVASGAWALATGRVQRWLSPPAAPPAHIAVPPAHIAVPRVQIAASANIATIAPASPATAPVASPPLAPSAAAPVVVPAHRRAAHQPARTTSATTATEATALTPATDDAALYTRAHELHFHGGAPADALAAWDAYLAAAPHGAFAPEASYNRALCLVRLGRLAEARTALEPFARGEVEPAGYRQPDAAHLIERIDRRTNRTRANGVNGSP